MRRVESIAALRQQLDSWRHAGERIAFVPTMGSLHAGHLALVTAARQAAERVVVSIFVNPLQFGPNEDFQRYPRSLDEDSRKLAETGADLLFAPPVDEVYPRGPAQATRVEVAELGDILEGAHRPGHFSGVATVVAKLFNMVQPQQALFGEKDYQQLLVIRRMAADLCFPVQVVGLPTVRQADGLALSSRNAYLSPDQRVAAPALYQALRRAAASLAQGERDFAALEQAGMAALQAVGFEPDYFAIRRADTLQPPGADAAEVVILAAARLGQTRLIDNIRQVLVK